MTAPTDLVKDVYAAFGRGDLAAVLAACAPDVDWRCHAPSCVPFGGEFAGRDGVKTFFEKLLGAVRLTSFAPRTFLADGDTVVVLGRDAGVAVATGREFADEWVHVFTVKGGKISAFAEFMETAPLEAAFRRG
jgi:hypothetical protein